MRLQNREEVKGDIKKETFREVTIALPAGGAKSYSLSQIAPDGIVYENEPQELRDAKEALREREFPRAHRGFRTVIELCEAASERPGAKDAGKKKEKAKVQPRPVVAATTIRPIFLQHALHGEVETFAAEGKQAEALKAIDELLDAFPDSYFLTRVLFQQVRLAGPKGFDAAVAAAKKRATEVGAAEEVVHRLDLMRAQQLARDKKAAEAVAIYRELERSPVKSVSDAARLGLAEATLSGGNTVQAKIEFNGLLRDAADRPTQCGAARGLGDTLVKEMKGEQNAEGLREALESYLRAVVSYFPADGDPTEPYQEALFSAARCAEDLMNLSKKGDPKKTDPRAPEGYRVIARDLYQDLISGYPGTDGARKAAEAVRRLGPAGQAQ